MQDDGGSRARAGWLSTILDLVERAAGDVARLRRLVRTAGQAAELRHTELLGRLERLEPAPSPTAAGEPDAGRAKLSAAQLEALCRLDQSLHHLLRAEAAAPGNAPATTAEALAMVQLRVRNLQRSFGLEAIECAGQRFDDRRHCAHAVVDRADLPDGVVVEELAPGYALAGRVLRPALVVVNRRLAGPDPDRETAR